MVLILPVVLGVIHGVLKVIGQYADEVDELFDPWKDNCESMNPGNFTNSTVFPQPSPMPYEVTFSRTKINTQQGVYLDLHAPNTLTFQGFMIHAIEERTGEATGQFDTQNDDIDVFTCFGHLDSTAMHVNNTSKKNVRLRWVPDEEEVVYATFYVTVAESVEPLQNYWVRQRVGSVEITKGPPPF